MSKKTPTPLRLVEPDEVTDAAETVVEDTIDEPAAPQPPAPLTVGQQIANYAELTARLKRQYHLNEQTITRLFELALNERFTLIQMGLAGPRTQTPTPEDSDGSENTSEEDSSEG